MAFKSFGLRGGGVKLLKVRCLYIKEAASHRVGTAFGLGQPPPFIQHLHQTHDSHLAVSAADHLQETLWGGGGGQPYSLLLKQRWVKIKQRCICLCAAEDLYGQCDKRTVRWGNEPLWALILWFLIEGEDVTHWPSWDSWRSHSRWWVHTASLQKTKRLKPDRTCTESDTPGRTWGRTSTSG